MKTIVTAIILSLLICPVINISAQNEVSKNLKNVNDLSTLKISEESENNYTGNELSGA